MSIDDIVPSPSVRDLQEEIIKLVEEIIKLGETNSQLRKTIQVLLLEIAEQRQYIRDNTRGV